MRLPRCLRIYIYISTLIFSSMPYQRKVGDQCIPEILLFISFLLLLAICSFHCLPLILDLFVVYFLPYLYFFLCSYIYFILYFSSLFNCFLISLSLSLCSLSPSFYLYLVAYYLFIYSILFLTSFFLSSFVVSFLLSLVLPIFTYLFIYSFYLSLYLLLSPFSLVFLSSRPSFGFCFVFKVPLFPSYHSSFDLRVPWAEDTGWTASSDMHSNDCCFLNRCTCCWLLDQ
jgi:hypothetical protein